MSVGKVIQVFSGLYLLFLVIGTISWFFSYLFTQGGYKSKTFWYGLMFLVTFNVVASLFV